MTCPLGWGLWERVDGSWMGYERWGWYVCVCICAFKIMINLVRRRIALGSGNTALVQPLYSITQSNHWKGGFLQEARQ